LVTTCYGYSVTKNATEIMQFWSLLYDQTLGCEETKKNPYYNMVINLKKLSVNLKKMQRLTMTYLCRL